MGVLDGRIALITGAGRGIGAAIARYFAAEGAKVVVNDLGVAIDGTGADTSVAETVAAEIRDAGGEAIGNADDIANWDGARRAVDAAVAGFGDLHVVVNNAATERNLGLVDMSQDDFDSVVGVSLKGTFAVSHWAARHWRQRFEAGQRVDRSLVNTASGSGLLNPLPTQTNYAAAKAGVAAMTLIHALELGRYGVRVNCSSPSMVRTRLTENVAGMPPALAGGYDPTAPVNSAPLVAFLASAGCSVTGQVLSMRGGTVVANRNWSKGSHVEKAGLWTVAELAEAVPELVVDDPYEKLAAALDGALGSGLGAEGRAGVQAMVNAALDTAARGRERD